MLWYECYAFWNREVWSVELFWYDTDSNNVIRFKVQGRVLEFWLPHSRWKAFLGIGDWDRDNLCAFVIRDGWFASLRWEGYIIHAKTTSLLTTNVFPELVLWCEYTILYFTAVIRDESRLADWYWNCRWRLTLKLQMKICVSRHVILPEDWHWNWNCRIEFDVDSLTPRLPSRFSSDLNSFQLKESTCSLQCQCHLLYLQPRWFELDEGHVHNTIHNFHHGEMRHDMTHEVILVTSHGNMIHDKWVIFFSGDVESGWSWADAMPNSVSRGSSTTGEAPEPPAGVELPPDYVAKRCRRCGCLVIVMWGTKSEAIFSIHPYHILITYISNILLITYYFILSYTMFSHNEKEWNRLTEQAHLYFDMYQWYIKSFINFQAFSFCRSINLNLHWLMTWLMMFGMWMNWWSRWTFFLLAWFSSCSVLCTMYHIVCSQ